MNEEGITLTVWGNDGMPQDVIEGVERIIVYLLKYERSKVKAGLSSRGYRLSEGGLTSTGGARTKGNSSADSNTL